MVEDTSIIENSQKCKTFIALFGIYTLFKNIGSNLKSRNKIINMAKNYKIAF